ncbi:MAG: hypothetical protein RLZZ136_1520 [Pseudomonadota bacterium]
MRPTLRPLIGSVLLVVAACPALAQQGPMAQPSGQPAGAKGNPALNQALAKLGKDPRDISALIDAGNAALELGDVDAAVGFFARADQIQPNSPQSRAGLAGALVHSGNPYDAIPLFADAEAAGGIDPRLNAERGLAYDLVGDNATAQKYYTMVLATGPNDEVTRRLALSQAIAGDRAGMESTLAPLLARGDKPAQRTHAFALAIAGRTEDAVAIANQTMPPSLAQGIAPYLRYMPRLTKAQQAAAANFGHFPRAADIGRDDPRVIRFAPPAHVVSADAALTPVGEPLGAKGHKGKDKGKDKPAAAPVELAAAPPARIAPPDLQPRREQSETPTAVVAPIAPPAVAIAKPAPLPVPITPAPAPVSSAPVSSAPVQASPSGSGIASTQFDLGQMNKPAPVAQAIPVPAPAVASPAAPAPAPRAEPARPPSFADAFGDLAPPQPAALPASGAVDLRKIAPTRPKPSVPPKPVYPSRIWVEVGVGRNKAALGFTWRGLVKDNPELLRGKTASVTEWGRTNRLLTGPFASESAAEGFVTKLKRAGLDAFLWTSPAGQVVDPLGGK